ncbi:MAG: flagellar hook capping FlgD N-terminal domain-containing protein [Alphaproteobacteria bacterium]
MVTAAAASSTTGASAVASLVGNTSALENANFDTFLKLLVAQLKNQDPLNPMEGTEFTSQIAQFSQLEQTIKSNSFLDKLSKTQDYSLQGLAIGTIGKEVLMPGSKGTLANGTMDFGYKLEDIAGRVEIEIVNASGQTIRTLNGEGKAGVHNMTWDGKNADGIQQADGPYTFRISASDFEGTKIPADLYSFAVVNSVTNDGDGNVTVSTTDGRTAAFDKVLSIRTPQS